MLTTPPNVEFRTFNATRGDGASPSKSKGAENARDLYRRTGDASLIDMKTNVRFLLRVPLLLIALVFPIATQTWLLVRLKQPEMPNAPQSTPETKES